MRFRCNIVRGRTPLELHGALVFQNKQCRNCHALGGEGGQRGPALDAVATRLTRDEMVRQVIQGGGNMPAYGKKLSPAEVEALVSFMQTLRPRSVPPVRNSDKPRKPFAARFRGCDVSCRPFKPVSTVDSIASAALTSWTLEPASDCAVAGDCALSMCAAGCGPAAVARMNGTTRSLAAFLSRAGRGFPGDGIAARCVRQPVPFGAHDAASAADDDCAAADSAWASHAAASARASQDVS